MCWWRQEYLGDSKEGLTTLLVEETKCHLKAWRFQCVLPLGIIYRNIRKTSHIFGLGDPIDSMLSSKEGPIFTPTSHPPTDCCVLSNSINYSSCHMVTVGFCSIQEVKHAHYGRFRKHRKVLKKITHILITPGHLLLPSLYFLPKRF